MVHAVDYEYSTAGTTVVTSHSSYSCDMCDFVILDIGGWRSFIIYSKIGYEYEPCTPIHPSLFYSPAGLEGEVDLSVTFLTSRGYGCPPFSPPVVELSFIPEGLQKSHCSSIFIELCQRALALSAMEKEDSAKGSQA